MMQTEYMGTTRTYTAESMAQAMAVIKRELGKDVEIVAQRTVRRGGFLGFGARTEVEVIARVMPRRPGSSARRSRSRGDANPSDDFASEARKVVQVAKGRLASRGNDLGKEGWISAAPMAPSYSGAPERMPSAAAGGRAWAGTDASQLVREIPAGLYGPGGRRTGPARGSFQGGESAILSPNMRNATPVDDADTGYPSATPGHAAPPRGTSSPELQNLREEFAELKDLILGQARAQAAPPAPRLDERRVSTGEPSAGLAHATEEGDRLADTSIADPIESVFLRGLHARLANQGVPEGIARGIIERVAKRTSAEELEDRAVIESRVAKEIQAMVRIAPAIEPHPDKPRIIVAVGPTGVGKTTTLAKLGGIFYEEEQFSVAYLTLDNYRIAAAEQLRSYSDIIGVTFEQVASAAELRDAVERNMDKEFILIDTAGRSPYAREAIDELKEMLSALSVDPHILLLVSAATAPEEMETAIKNFRISERSELVFTKLDETQRWGGVFAAAVRSGLPVSYCTTGQNVPTDIEPALASRFAEELLASGPERAASPRNPR
jgi:flagellar biosynthetic protein FlhF